MSRVSHSRQLACRVAVFALVVSLVTFVAPGPASADTPTVTVTPSTVVSGEYVTLDLTGFPASTQALSALNAFLCPTTIDPATLDWYGFSNTCASLWFSLNVTEIHESARVNDTNTPPGGAFTCSTVPGGCMVIGLSSEIVGSEIVNTAIVSAPITITPAGQTVTVPETAVNGQTFTVETSGFANGTPGAIGVCPYDVTRTTVSRCGAITSFPTGIPTSAAIVAHAQVELPEGWSRCTYACVIAAWTTDDGAASFATASLNVADVELSASPSVNVDDGATVTVDVANASPGPATIQQCPAGDGSDASPCTAPQTFTVSADGTATVDITFRNPFTGGDGQSRECEGACTLRVVTSDGPLPYVTGIAFFRPEILSLQSDPVPDGGTVPVLLQYFPDGEVTVAQCARDAVGTDLASSDCTGPQTVTSVDDHAFLPAYTVHATFEGRSGPVDCKAVQCVVVAFGSDGTVAVNPFVLEFFTPLAMTLSPDTGLHDGESISVEAEGLRPDLPYRIVRCLRGVGSIASRCEPPGSDTISSDWAGRATGTTTALQRFTTAGGLFRSKACRGDACSIAILDQSGSLVIEEPYALAAPSVSADPASGLQDGDAVTVTATDLQPTYAGPTVLFPSGGWTLTVCDQAVGSDPTIVDVFTHCGLPDGAGPVDVPGTTATETVNVPATLTKILGGTSDCTASPGACVVGFARWEQNASVSSTFTPLTFG